MKSRTKATLCLLVVGLCLTMQGCGLFASKPVSLSPEIRSQVTTANIVLIELERRAKLGQLDPNDVVLAIGTAQDTLQTILDADEVGKQ